MYVCIFLCVCVCMCVYVCIYVQIALVYPVLLHVITMEISFLPQYAAADRYWKGLWMFCQSWYRMGIESTMHMVPIFSS